MRARNIKTVLTCPRCGKRFLGYKRTDKKGLCSKTCGRQNTPDGFWKKCDKKGDDDCWLWQSARRGLPCVYGSIRWHGRSESAHRVAWSLTHGPIPQGMEVCHKCDIPLCVNPDHLFLGTHKDNMKDRNAKGRTASGNRSGARTKPEAFRATVARGERAGGVKLTEQKVLEIRSKYSRGVVPYSQLAAEYGVDLTTIAQIVKRHTWTHI